MAPSGAPEGPDTREAALMKALTGIASVTGASLDKAMTVMEDLVRDGWSPPAVTVELVATIPEPVGWMVVERPHGRPVVHAWDGIVHPTRSEADAECAHANRPGHGSVDSWRVVAVHEPPLPPIENPTVERTS